MGVDIHSPGPANKKPSPPTPKNVPLKKDMNVMMQGASDTPTKESSSTSTGMSLKQFMREKKHAFTTKYPFLTNSQVEGKLRSAWRKEVKKSSRGPMSGMTEKKRPSYGQCPLSSDTDESVGGSSPTSMSGSSSLSSPHIRPDQLGSRTYKDGVVWSLSPAPKIISKSPDISLQSILSKSAEKKTSNRVCFDESSIKSPDKQAGPETSPEVLSVRGKPKCLFEAVMEESFEVLDQSVMYDNDISDSDEERELQLTALHATPPSPPYRQPLPVMKKYNKKPTPKKRKKSEENEAKDDEGDIYDFPLYSDDAPSCSDLSGGNKEPKNLLLGTHRFYPRKRSASEPIPPKVKKWANAVPITKARDRQGKRQTTITSMFKNMEMFGKSKAKETNSVPRSDEVEDQEEGEMVEDSRQEERGQTVKTKKKRGRRPKNPNTVISPGVVKKTASGKSKTRKLTNLTPAMSPSLLAKTLKKASKAPQKRRPSKSPPPKTDTESRETVKVTEMKRARRSLETASFHGDESSSNERLTRSKTSDHILSFTGGVPVLKLKEDIQSSPETHQRKCRPPATPKLVPNTRDDLALLSTPAKNTRASVRRQRTQSLDIPRTFTWSPMTATSSKTVKRKKKEETAEKSNVLCGAEKKGKKQKQSKDTEQENLLGSEEHDVQNEIQNSDVAEESESSEEIFDKTKKGLSKVNEEKANKSKEKKEEFICRKPNVRMAPPTPVILKHTEEPSTPKLRAPTPQGVHTPRISNVRVAPSTPMIPYIQTVRQSPRLQNKNITSDSEEGVFKVPVGLPRASRRSLSRESQELKDAIEQMSGYKRDRSEKEKKVKRLENSSSMREPPATEEEQIWQVLTSEEWILPEEQNSEHREQLKKIQNCEKSSKKPVELPVDDQNTSDENTDPDEARKDGGGTGSRKEDRECGLQVGQVVKSVKKPAIESCSNLKEASEQNTSEEAEDDDFFPEYLTRAPRLPFRPLNMHLYLSSSGSSDDSGGRSPTSTTVAPPATPSSQIVDDAVNKMRKILSPDIMGLDNLDEYISDDIFSSPFNSPINDLLKDLGTSAESPLAEIAILQPVDSGGSSNEEHLNQDGRKLGRRDLNRKMENDGNEMSVLDGLFDKPESPSPERETEPTPRTARRRLMRSKSEGTESNFMELFSKGGSIFD